MKGKKTANHFLELEHNVEEVNRAIVQAYESSCPISCQKDPKETPWWNKTLGELRSKVRKLFNKAKRDGDWQTYTMELTRYNMEIRRAKRNSFRVFCENIASTPAAARLHKALA